MTRSKTPTLRDVAKKAGVHFSTVSRALNPATRRLVNPRVVERIDKAAEALRYRPNQAAVGLRTSRPSFQVNVLLPRLERPECAPLVDGVRTHLKDTRYIAIVGDAQRVVGQEGHSLHVMTLRSIGGLILATAKLEDTLVNEAVNDGMAIVQVLRTTSQKVCSTVTVDYAYAMETAVRHLRSFGHQRIALVCGPLDVSTGPEALRAYEKAIEGAGNTLVEVAPDESVEAGMRAYRALRERQEGFTAILATSDLLALGCIDAAKMEGKSCPEDFSVIGFGDYPLVDRTTPALTTIRVDFRHIGALAAQLLVRAIERPTSSFVHHAIPTTLVCRASVGPCATSAPLERRLKQLEEENARLRQALSHSAPREDTR